MDFSLQGIGSAVSFGCSYFEIEPSIEMNQNGVLESNIYTMYYIYSNRRLNRKCYRCGQNIFFGAEKFQELKFTRSLQQNAARIFHQEISPNPFKKKEVRDEKKSTKPNET